MRRLLPVLAAVALCAQASAEGATTAAHSEALPSDKRVQTCGDCLYPGCMPPIDPAANTDTYLVYQFACAVAPNPNDPTNRRLVAEFDVDRALGDILVMQRAGLLGTKVRVEFAYITNATLAFQLNGVTLGTVAPAIYRWYQEQPGPPYIDVWAWTKQHFDFDIRDINWPPRDTSSTGYHLPGRPSGYVLPRANFLTTTVPADGFVQVAWVTLKFDCADPVLFLHGWNGSPKMWQPWDTYMQGTIGLPYDSQRDFGKSYSLQRNIADIDSEFGIMHNAYGTEHVSVVGHSKGGIVGRRYAAAHDGRVRHLTTIATPHLGSPLVVNQLIEPKMSALEQLGALLARRVLRFIGAMGPGWGELAPRLLTDSLATIEFAPHTSYEGIAGDWDGSVQDTLGLAATWDNLSHDAAVGVLLGLQRTRKILQRVLPLDPHNDGVVSLGSALGFPYGGHDTYPGHAGTSEACHVRIADAPEIRETYIRSRGGFGSTSDAAPPVHAEDTPVAMGAQLPSAVGLSIGDEDGIDSTYCGSPATLTCIVYTGDSTAAVAVRVPGLGWIDSTRAAGDPDVVLKRIKWFDIDATLAIAKATQPGYLAYAVAHPAAAVSDSSAFVAIAFAEGDSAGITVQCDPAAPTVGDSALLVVSGTRGGQCSSCTDSVFVMAPDGSITPRVLRDDGVAPDDVAGDGTAKGFSGPLAMGGTYYLRAVRSCRDGGGALCSREADGQSFEATGSSSGSVTTELDANGAIANLAADFVITMPADGRVIAFGTLTSSSEIVARAATDTSLTAGSHVVRLEFSGREIYATDRNGPFQVQGLAEMERDSVGTRVVLGPIASDSYAHTAFAHDRVRVRGPLTWQGTDPNGNGKADTLWVRVPIATEVAGAFISSAMLEDALGNQLQTVAYKTDLVPGDTAVWLEWPGVAIGQGGQSGSYVVHDFVTQSASGDFCMSDSAGAITGVLASAFEGFIPDSLRVQPVHPVVAPCPGGDGDSVLVRLKMPVRLGTSARIEDHSLWAVRTSTSGGVVTLWHPGLYGSTSGESLQVLALNDADTTAVLGWVSAGGCGTTTWQCYVDGGAVGVPVSIGVRGYDQDGHAIGSVDRFDNAELAAAWSRNVPCWDLDHNGSLVDQNDFFVFSRHYGHHVARRLMYPDGGQSLGPGETVPISWVGGIGDSARVTLRVFNGSQSPDTVVIAQDLLDTGSYSWTVPTGRVPLSNYRVQVVHTAGYYGVDYLDVGMATSDSDLTILPVPVHDLTATAAKTTCVLTWTEPGQAGHAASGYVIKYRTDAPITEANWASSDSILQSVVPSTAGTVHCLDLTVTACRTYYFGIKTRCGGLSSRVSNVASVQTRCSGNLFTYCDVLGLIADGSANAPGVRRRRVDTASAGQRANASDSAVAGAATNTLLWRTSRGNVSDLYKYPMPGSATDGEYPVALVETGDMGAQLDAASLGVVDHASAIEAYGGENGVLLGTTSGVAGLVNELGAPVPLGGSAGGTSYGAVDGQYLDVDLGASPGARALVLTAWAPSPQPANDSSGVWIEVPSADSTWAPAGVIHPRRQSDDRAVEVGNSTRGTVRFSV